MEQPQNQKSAELALAYHQRQAGISNWVVLAFLGVLVAFTLYRVLAEWSLAQQYQAIAEYRQTMEQVEKLEKTNKKLAEEIDFIEGKDEDGSPFTVEDFIPPDDDLGDESASIERFFQQQRRLLRVVGNERISNSRKYSPFGRSCKFSFVGGVVKLGPPMLDSFLPQAMAELGYRILSESPERAIDAFCLTSNIPNASKSITAADEELLKRFETSYQKYQQAVQAGAITSESGCKRQRLIIDDLIEIVRKGWYPNGAAEVDEYLTNSTCALSSKFLSEASQLVERIQNLSLPVIERVRIGKQLFRQKEVVEFRGSIDVRDIRQLFESAKSRRSEREMEQIKNLKADRDNRQATIDRLKQMKPLSDESSAARDKFSLHQLLLSALFVLSSLAAAVSSSFVARAHSCEVIEIERQLRAPSGHHKIGGNPFSKQPKSLSEVALLGDLRELLKPPKASTSSGAPGSSDAKHSSSGSGDLNAG